MKNRILLSLLIIILPFFHLQAEEQEGNTYKTEERLFHIARSANRNLVCYDINLKNGKLDTSNPLNVYWINREEHPGKKGGLSFIQRKLAYGYKLVSSHHGTCVCSLTAYPKRKLTIKQDGTEYVCLIKIQNEDAILKSLYVKANPKNPLSVEYVELRGISTKTHQMITERVKK